jgi:predicted RNA binding protein YcfA (HicA-like mRNA interferase family)
MAGADRARERLLRLPSEMRFSEVETLLLSLGWSVRHGKSSHVVLLSPSNKAITIATTKGRTVKRKYPGMIADEIE